MPAPARIMNDAATGHRVSSHGDAEVWPVSVEWSMRTPGATATRPLVMRVSTYEEEALERRISPPPSTVMRDDGEYVQSARYIKSLRRARCRSRPFRFVLRNLLPSAANRCVSRKFGDMTD